MPREVVSAPSVRIPPKSIDLQKQLEEQAEARHQKNLKVMEAIANHMAKLPVEKQMEIRMRVALTVPDKPMTREELQLWLDEKTLGVLSYMRTGSLP